MLNRYWESVELVNRLVYRGPQVLAGLLFALILLVVGAILATGSSLSSVSDPLAAPQTPTTKDSTLAVIGVAVKPLDEPVSPQTAAQAQPSTSASTAEAAGLSSESDPTSEPFPTSTGTGPGSSSSPGDTSTTGTTVALSSSTTITTGGAGPTTTVGNTTTSCPSGWVTNQDHTYCVDEQPTTTTPPPPTIPTTQMVTSTLCPNGSVVTHPGSKYDCPSVTSMSTGP